LTSKNGYDKIILLRNIFDASEKKNNHLKIVKIIIERFGITMEITRESIIGDILDFDPTTAIYFLEIGMHCLGCPASRMESLEDACAVHGTDVEELVAKLSAHFANK
jgi:hybrid cluster-associated redox disulfide protein